MTTPSPRQQFLAAAEEIEQVYRDTSGPLGYDGRRRVRKAYEVLQQLGTCIPGAEPGRLTYGNMDDQALAAAVRDAEKGLASPAVTLELVSQVRRLREELAAFGGPHGVTDSDIRSMLGEGFHTAFRKAVDSPVAAVIHKLIRDMEDGEYGSVIDFTADPLITMLREAEQRAKSASGRRAYEQYYRNADQEPPPWELESETVRQSWIAIAVAAIVPAGDSEQEARS